MAYQARRKNLYTEDFELTEENGCVVDTLHVSLDPDTMAKKLSEKHIAFITAIREIQNIDMERESAKAWELFETTVSDVLEAVFGKEDADKITEFYGSRYLEICTNVMPFITDTVIPKVRELARESKKEIAAGYNRKRRLFSGKK